MTPATQAKLARLAMWDRIIAEGKARKRIQERKSSGLAYTPAFCYIGAVRALLRAI